MATVNPRSRQRRPPRPGALADLAPMRILRQIVTLQLVYYAAALVLLIFTAFVSGAQPSPDLLLGWQHLRGDVTEGWMYGLDWLLVSLITVVPLLLLIARSKLIPDFALTIHAVHLIATSIYSHSIPRHYFWWGLQAASASLMVSLGVWSCQWRELQPLKFGGLLESGQRSAEAAVGRVMGGGSGQDGSYEMVNQK